MTDWLEPVRRALERDEPARVFFRVDDVGWAHDRLFRLLNLFGGYGIPLDLAVIPEALTSALAEALLRRPRISVHQHGFAHVNHEPDGRKCEFGPARGEKKQRDDINVGRAKLRTLLEPLWSPAFTPPWNRCTHVTARCLVDLGFRTLSRESRAEPFGIEKLGELPVRIDWFARNKKRSRERVSPRELGERIASAIHSPGPTGIMLHHQLMDEGERCRARELLSVLAASDGARCCLMSELRA